MTNLILVGFGYWGKNLARVISSAKDCNLFGVVETDSSKIAQLKALYPQAVLVTGIDEISGFIGYADAVVISTPVNTHYKLAKVALENGFHVLLEKPMTATVTQALELISLSQKMGKVLMIDHTFLYTGAVKKIKSLAGNGELGTINYYDSTRINLGLFQPDVNVLWDLAPHDLSILFHLSDYRPVGVTATGISHLRNGIENLAYLTLHYREDMIAHLTCSWSSPVKIRKILLGGDKQMVLYDDMEPTEKIKIYDTGFSASIIDEQERVKLLVDYRTGDIHVPKLETREALAGLINDFHSAIAEGTKPVSDWQIGLDVVRVLEAAQQSIKSEGKLIAINYN